MHYKRILRLAPAAALIVGLSACNIGKAPEPTPDVNALYTVAAETLVAKVGLDQTETAAANSPTPAGSPTAIASFTPLPTFPASLGLTPFGTLSLTTPLPGVTPLSTQSSGSTTNGYAVGCDNAEYIGQSVDDGTAMNPGKEFTVGFSMQNSGTCAWDDGYSFAFKTGDQMSGQDQTIVSSDQFTDPGHSQAFILHLKAPKEKGEYKGYWQMQNDSGVWFGSLVWIDILVD
jgi:hypothetical protein